MAQSERDRRPMTLSFHEIGLRFPDAVVYWDRDVAPTLDWEPRFVDVSGRLTARRPGCHHHRDFLAKNGGCGCIAWSEVGWIGMVEWFRRQPVPPLDYAPPWSQAWRAEQHRRSLGLASWNEHRRNNEANGIPIPRRSGRTMRGLLFSIAECQTRGVSRIVIDGLRTPSTKYSADLARDLLRELDVGDVSVTVSPRNHSRDVVYRDHYPAEH